MIRRRERRRMTEIRWNRTQEGKRKKGDRRRKNECGVGVVHKGLRRSVEGEGKRGNYKQNKLIAVAKTFLMTSAGPSCFLICSYALR